MAAHAILSPSSASRWLACTPSARLESQVGSATSEAAEEGTLAHALGELKLQLHFGLISKEKYKLERKTKIETSKYYNEAMDGYTDDYMAYCVEKYNELLVNDKHTVVELERKLDLTEFVPDGFGTADFSAAGDGKVIMIDLKYGKGVPVSAVDNKQLKIYALGVVRRWELICDVKEVTLHIFQPRIDNTTEYTVSIEDLERWAEEELKPKAELAYKGEGEFVAGKHCQFCKVRATCRTNAEYHLELAKYDFRHVNFLSPEEVADIIAKSSSFKTWLTSIEEHALTEALQGKSIPGYKVVEGRSNRTITDEESAVKLLKANGFEDEDIYNKKLLGITALEKKIGKKVFENILGKYVIKPAGSPTLAPLSDKRPSFSSAESDFKDLLD